MPDNSPQDQFRQKAHAAAVASAREQRDNPQDPAAALKSEIATLRAAQQKTQAALDGFTITDDGTVTVSGAGPKGIVISKGSGGGSGSGAAGTIPDVIIVFNGTAKYCTLQGTIGADV